MFEAGLVLEGGGMRGLFTAGVLDFFIEKDIFFSEVIGVSAGACHACSYLSGQHGRAKAVSIDYLNDKRYCGLYSLLTTGDLFGANFAYDNIPNNLNLFDNDAFEKKQSMFFATATNVETGQAEYLKIENLNKNKDIIAVRASASLPLVSRIVEYKSKKYLDGGMTDSIPIKKIQSDGFKKNIIVLTQPKGYIKTPNNLIPLIKLKYRKYPNLINAMTNRHIIYNNTIKYIEEQEKLNNIFVLSPTEKLIVDRIEKDKKKLEMVYELGYKNAKSNYSGMMKYLS